MLTRNIKTLHLNYLPAFAFAAKKQKMELTIRTPYRTLFENFDGFSRVITKTNEAALIIQNRSPPSLHVLPPGFMKVKLTSEVKGVTGEFMHLGGWVVIHP